MQNRIIANDTKVGPTSPGIWAVFLPNDEIAYLRCWEKPDTAVDFADEGKTDDLVWSWDDEPDEPSNPDILWTKGWYCAPIGCLPADQVSDWALERMVP